VAISGEGYEWRLAAFTELGIDRAGAAADVLLAAELLPGLAALTSLRIDAPGPELLSE
jgi:hypothetical protein